MQMHKWDGITVAQIDFMKHAIGFQGRRVQRKIYKAYRNYFTVSEPDTYWEKLVELGLAKSQKFEHGIGENATVYFVTGEGKTFLSELLGIKIIETD
jgi:hypothetical protein